ncbi:MAG TPA: PAS domain-containing sensor histidine kinase [Caulobacteraceae bacterium]|nr:PAS domain-containing sensor histidine kinase [Caulobacteraceae bacterium]
MAVDASRSEDDSSPTLPRVAGAWRARLPAGSALGAGYALAAALIGIAVWMASSAPVTGPVGPPSRAILIVLGLNLVLIGGLAFVAGGRVFRLVVAQRRDAGARLHLRFVAVFATAAVAPAIVVAIVFGVLVNQSVDSWFSHRVATVVENSATVARSYVRSQMDFIRDNVSLMAEDLNHAAPELKQNPIRFSQFLAVQASLRGFPAVYVLDRDGRVLARAEVDAPPEFLAPPPAAFAAADSGVIDAERFDSTDMIRALYKLKGFDDAYLYVARPVERGILTHLSETNDSLAAYRDTAANRDRIEAALELSYIETVLLVLVGAVWIGMAAASGISGPVARLIQAADRIAAGDLAARVNVGPGSQEMSDLARSFNRMTGDLQEQQAALRAAGEEAESRRQFIETVLSGVSAGVISVDGEGRILTLNRQAAVLLGLPASAAHGKRLDEAAPEFADVVAEAQEYGGDAEAEIDLVRERETRRLRVRASGHADGGLVLTFDDITRLVTAQRNAAWKDVARRIAHEIKNPLTPIQLSAERLKRKFRKDIVGDLETFDRCTETIIRQVGDVSRMVDEFSAFARMPAPKFERADAAELLRQAVFAQRVAHPETEVELAEPMEPAPALCDERMIGQALANVLKNAGEAIAARKRTEPGLKGRIRARLVVEGDDLAFEIEDNGKGLPAKDRDRLTEPYVTTREKGTGLGLAIVKRIMEDHGGALVLLDAAERPGAKAVLRLPRMKTLDVRAETDTEAA